MHKEYLLQALKLAETRRGFCAPNPAVGAVIVKQDRVIGQGAHQAAGQPHAEIEALKNCGETAKDSTLYVTLEPCCHHGRTPPCVEAILAAGIKTVYFGYLDPNPKVAGQGQQQLRLAGVVCEHIPITAIDEFYRSYRHWTLTGKPWVTVKLALSLDGKIAGANGAPVKISGPELQEYTHQQRQKSDAILSTVETVLHDNPALNVRLNSIITSKTIYLLDSSVRFPSSAQLNHTAKSITLIHSKSCQNSIPNNCKSHAVDAGLDLKQAVEKIGTDGIHDLWVEVGAKCFNSFITSSLADEVIFYLSLNALGADAQPAFQKSISLNDFYSIVSMQQFGADILLKLQRNLTV